MKPQAKLLPELDAIRGIAALTVAVWHWFSMARLRDDWFITLFDWLYRASEFAVTTFFVLSGCVLTMSIMRSREDNLIALLKGYFIRRSLRIMPPVFIVVSVSFVGMWLLREYLDISDAWKRYSDFSLSRLVRNLLLDDNHFNPPGWTLRFEVAAYALLPFLILSFARQGVERIACAAIFVVLAWVIGTHWTTWPDFIMLMPTFLPGVALALITINREGSLSYLMIGVLGLGLLAQIEAHHYDLAFLVSIACAALVAAGLNATQIAHGALTHRFLRWLGDISYGVYLWHYPILWAFFYLAGEYVGTRDMYTFVMAGIVCLPLTLVVSHLSYHYFEKPIMGLGRRASNPARTPAIMHAS